jgi:hypothetical protein
MHSKLRYAYYLQAGALRRHGHRGLTMGPSAAGLAFPGPRHRTMARLPLLFTGARTHSSHPPPPNPGVLLPH